MYVKAIVQRGPRFLVLRRSRTHPTKALRWDLPGGKACPGEAHVAALRREAREETGLELDDVRLLAAVGTAGFVYLARTYDSAIRLSAEHDLSWWIGSQPELDAISIPEKYRSLLHVQLQLARTDT